MKASAPPARGRSLRSWHSDPRLGAYLVAGFGAFILALAGGQSSVAVLGVPFLVLAGLGLARGRPHSARATLALRAHQVVEGRDVEGTVHLEWDGPAEVDVLLTGWRGVVPVKPGGVLQWSLLSGTGPARLDFTLRATTWGRHELGTVWVRARRPGGLHVAEWRFTPADAVLVLPAPERLERLLRPRVPRTAAGVHPTPMRGAGTDLAELRAYQPGDRLRDLSWATSARLAEPWVRVHHPERTGTVLLMLDSFVDEGSWGRETLARGARAAWTVTSAHLRAQDQVGFLAQGSSVAWVPPQGGRRARWLLLREMLAVGGAIQEGRRRWGRGGRLHVPSDALIVGVTSLRSADFVRALLHYRRAGHPTVALVVDGQDLLPEDRDVVDEAARALWVARRETQRAALERASVPTALVSGDRGVDAAVATLRRRVQPAGGRVRSAG